MTRTRPPTTSASAMDTLDCSARGSSVKPELIEPSSAIAERHGRVVELEPRHLVTVGQEVEERELC